MKSESTPSFISLSRGDGELSLVGKWVHFWFRPIDPIGLHALRILAGLLITCWLLSFAGHQQALFSLNGWLDTQGLREASRLPNGLPAPLNWSILYLGGTNETALNLIYLGSLVVVGLFTLGLFTRITSVLTWIVVVSFSVHPAISYGGDYLLIIFAFYLMIGYLLLGQWGGNLSLLERVLGPWDALMFGRVLFAKNQHFSREIAWSHGANLAIRLLQVNFALLVFTSGLHKLQFGDWWGGWAFWYPMHDPFKTTFASVQTTRENANAYLFFLSLIVYATLAWQLAFPLFAWRKNWRIVLLGGGLLGWIGAFWVLQLPLFGPLFFLGSLSFLTTGEWLVLKNWSRSQTPRTSRPMEQRNVSTRIKSAKVNA